MVREEGRVGRPQVEEFTGVGNSLAIIKGSSYF
jgi:hypothetical protein